MLAVDQHQFGGSASSSYAPLVSEVSMSLENFMSSALEQVYSYGPPETADLGCSSLSSMEHSQLFEELGFLSAPDDDTSSAEFSSFQLPSLALQAESSSPDMSPSTSSSEAPIASLLLVAQRTEELLNLEYTAALFGSQVKPIYRELAPGISLSLRTQPPPDSRAWNGAGPNADAQLPESQQEAFAEALQGLRCLTPPLLQPGGVYNACTKHETIVRQQGPFDVRVYEIVSSDGTAVARLALPAFVHALCGLLKCTAQELLVVPYSPECIIVGVCSDPLSACAAGTFTLAALADNAFTFLSAKPLQLSSQGLKALGAKATEDQWVSWEEYWCHGTPVGAVSYGLVHQFPVPTTQQQADTLLAAIRSGSKPQVMRVQLADQCFHCRRSALQTMCSGCCIAKYCSVECQHADWGICHSKVCSSLKEKASPGYGAYAITYTAS